MDVKAKDVGSPSFTRVALPGYYAISMIKDAFHTYYITAVAEGGRTTDVIHTDATVIKAWEKFRFINGGPTDPYFSIQTLAGYFLSAVNSGGLTANAITSAATSVGDWELLAFKPQSGTSYTPHFAIQTTRGYFLTAVGHGGHNSGDTIHSDATVAKDWEMFDFIKDRRPRNQLHLQLPGTLLVRRKRRLSGSSPEAAGVTTALPSSWGAGRDTRSPSRSFARTTEPTPSKHPAATTSPQTQADFQERATGQTPRK